MIHVISINNFLKVQSNVCIIFRIGVGLTLTSPNPFGSIEKSMLPLERGTREHLTKV